MLYHVSISLIGAFLFCREEVCSMDGEEIRVHMPYEVFKNLLERAGSIKRDEGKLIQWTNYSGSFTNQQKKEIDDVMNQFIED